MTDNPYAPPQASGGTRNGDTRLSPPLWNPGAAAAWSLLFGPIFGAIIHMKNWQALGQPGKAAVARRWLIGNVLLLLAALPFALLLPPSGAIGALNSLAGFGLLLAWYLISARDQVRFVATAYGTAYQRRGWGTPLLYAVLAITGTVLLIGILGSVIAASRAA